MAQTMNSREQRISQVLADWLAGIHAPDEAMTLIAGEFTDQELGPDGGRR